MTYSNNLHSLRLGGDHDRHGSIRLAADHHQTNLAENLLQTIHPAEEDLETSLLAAVAGLETNLLAVAEHHKDLVLHMDLAPVGLDSNHPAAAADYPNHLA